MKKFEKMGYFFIATAVFFVFFIVGNGKNTAFAYTRIFYYTESKAARNSFYKHYSSIDVFAPQAYSATFDGALEGKINPNVLNFAHAHHIKVMPLVTNKMFNSSDAKTFLDDFASQDALVNSLIAEGKKQIFWGWQIDFEQIDASYRDKFSLFVKKVGDGLKKNGMVASVAVVAQNSSNPNSYPNNLWQNVIGVYDYSALASSTDFISLMSYDDPVSKGPVARYSWLKDVINYTLNFVPHKKISLGIPFYYWRWNELGKRVGIGGNSAFQAILKKHYVTLRYSKIDQAPYATYTTKKKTYTIWYENAQSIKKKISLVKANALPGFSAWALGLELPSVFGVMGK
jgi:spore germination protein YaaH